MEESNAPIGLVVVDDHAVTRAGICRWLNEEPDINVVAQAQKGNEALRLVKQYHPDVLLTDIELPDLCGLDLVYEVQQSQPDIKAVLMTAYNGWYVHKILEFGEVGYLSKEAERERFILAIHWAAQGKYWIDPDALIEEMNRVREFDYLGLTPTERRILTLIDRPNKEISEQLGMKETTLRKTHFSNIYFKIGVNRRYEAIAWAIERKLLERDGMY